MGDIIAKVIPIILFISIGYYLRYKNIFSQSTINDLKKLIINVSLAAVLFNSFLNMELKVEYFLVFIVIFIMLLTFFIIGFGLNKIKIISHPVLPYLLPGFSFGLLGIPLFTSIFGTDNAGKISIIGVGHEFFVWIILYTVMKMNFKKEKFSIDVLKNIIKSPLILSITFGIIFNVTGLSTIIQSNYYTKGFYLTIKNLADIATPLILIIIGYGLKFNKKYMKLSIKFLIVRIIVNFVIGYAFKILLIDRILPYDQLFDYAYFTFLILCPPFSLSIFIGAYSNKEYEELANNTIVLNTLISIITFIIFVLFI